MNCPQCQAVNGPGAAFCSACGTRLAPAEAGGQASVPGTPPGFSTPAGYTVPAAPGYGPSGGQAPGGYSPGRHQSGQSRPSPRRSAALPPVNFDQSRLTTVDKVVAVATLITMISLWLPWFSGTYSALGVTSSGSISGTGDHGWLWLEFLLALALLAYFAARAAWDQLPFSLPLSHAPLLIAGTGLQFLLILIGFFNLPSTDGIQGLSITWDFGAILALIASTAAAAPVIYPAVRSYLDSRKVATGGSHRY
jgi:Double zinc ribbon